MNPGKLEQLRIAVVHDQLATAGGAGGAERVLSLVMTAFPHADLFTTVYNAARMPDSFRSYNIKTSFIQKLPFGNTKYQWYLPLMPIAVEEMDLSRYDLVLSFSHAVAKGVITSPQTTHLCYCYSPLRYAWDKYNEYMKFENIGVVSKFVIPAFMNYLRMWDVTSASRVDSFATLSRFVADRIWKFYRRESTVIYPPCSIDQFSVARSTDDYYLIVSRLVTYKRIDLAIEACNRLGRRLRIIGDGTDLSRLRSLAGPTIEFLGRRNDREVADQFSRCRAFIFPGEEDFGIAPLEAQASGRPVIAFGSGGALETIRGVFPSDIGRINGKASGIFFQEQSVKSIIEAVKAFEVAENRFDPSWIQKSVRSFSPEVFLRGFVNFVSSAFSRSETRKSGSKGQWR